MPAIVVTALKGHRTRQLEERLAAGGAWKESGLLFMSPIGTVLDPRNVSREFHALLKAAAPSKIGGRLNYLEEGTRVREWLRW